MSLVKVFVPCYRYAHFLPAAVGSVLSQSGVDVRVLILDDCSPDETPAVARDLMARDSRVAYHRNPVNIGHIATYNIGLDWAADGDYTVLLSADDMLTPGALRRAAGLLDAHPQVGFAYGGSVVFSDHQNLPPARTPDGMGSWQIILGQQWLGQAFTLGRIIIRSPEVVVRTRLQRQIGGYDPQLPHAGDIEMWMRFAANAAVGVITDADQAYYRIHNQNMHIERFSAHLADLRQRKAAYESVLRAYGAQITNVEILRARLYRRLAREALGMAGSRLDRGGPVDTVTTELLAFAMANDPGALGTLESLGLHARMILGPSLTPLLARARSAGARMLRLS